MQNTTTCKALNIDIIDQQDPEIAAALKQELKRQQDKIELIASENFTSLAVMQAQGTWLTNKYAEGLPEKRYYGGCEYVDIVEQLAIDRAKKVFNADHANVQPHSGASANLAVYFALLNPGDTIMGMNLAHGGHLTHGSPVSISGKYFKVIPYGVDKNSERINYDEMEALAKEHRPKMIVAGASAYPRIIDFKRISEIAKSINAFLFVDMAHIAGLVAAGLHPNPVEFADVVTTTTHKTLRGPRGGLILCKAEHQKAIDKAVFPGTQGGPLMHVIAAKAVCLKEALHPDFKTYQQQVIKNAATIATELQNTGFNIVSGGTDNHLLLVNLTNKNLTGKEAEAALDEVGITVNKNAVPFDQQSPFITSGIRIGTAAVTSRKMTEPAMKTIASLIAQTLTSTPDKSSIQKQVIDLSGQFPLYPELTA